MKIHDRILLGFIGLGVAIGVVGYVSLTISQHTLEETIGNASVDLASTTMGHMLDSFRAYADDIQRHAWPIGRHELLRQSNEAFDRLQDVNEAIRVAEEDWVSGDALDHVQAIAHNDISQYLRDYLECPDHYARTDKQRAYGEIFVTNRHGVNVAQTQQTSDYYQADELWWQRASADGIYVGPIQYDESSGIYEVDIAVRLNDANDVFAGVLKAVLNVRELVAALDQVHRRCDYASTRLRLVCGETVIYDSAHPALQAYVLDSPLLGAMGRKGGLEGFLEITDAGGTRRLLAFCRTPVRKEWNTPAATLMVEYDKAEILAPTVQVRAELLSMTVLLVLLSMLGGWLLARSISRPLAALTDMAEQISEGNLDIRSNVHTSGETGQLAAAFDRMARHLRGTLDELRNEIVVRQEAETALEAANRQLQDAIEKTNLINQELRNFVHVASHDLREPLRKVTFFGGLLRQSLDVRLAGEDRENLEFMVDGAERMTRLIDALLVYSRVGRKEGPLGPVDLNDEVDHLRKMELGPLLEETGATIEVPDPLPAVRAHSIQIAQLLQNLICNGIKFRRRDVAPAITITSRPADDDATVRIEVRDNGIGIEEKYRRDIFVMFKRLHTRSEYEGAGIGLATCKKIVECHGGRIGVDSEPGKGSVFWFTLPLAPQPSPTA
jgi:signal transduction histidine kinase